MASFNFDVPDSLIKQFSKMGNLDEIAPKMIDEAIPILEKEVKAECSKHVLTSAMVNSVKVKKTWKNQYGYYACVRPTGKDANGTRNMEKMAHAHFGTSHQRATPIVTPAINRARGPVIKKMQEVFNREVGAK